MSIIDIILTGLAWILAAAIILTLIFGYALLTCMQVEDERKESHEEPAPEGSTDPSAKRRRRRAACSYQGQVS